MSLRDLTPYVATFGLVAGLIIAWHFFGSRRKEPHSRSDTLDYSKIVFLDAEDLAETGIRKAYESLWPELQKHVPQPAPIEEVIDDKAARYAVKYGTRDFVIYSPDLDDNEAEGWARATVAFFTIVNDQLAHSPYRFYAINGGNDLGGMFLTPVQAVAVRKTLPNRTDWPYLPKDEPDWYGQYH
ncbi:MAG: hypothetical protein U1F61_21105 [Opitutaceae bacterium]